MGLVIYARPERSQECDFLWHCAHIVAKVFDNYGVGFGQGFRVVSFKLEGLAIGDKGSVRKLWYDISLVVLIWAW